VATQVEAPLYLDRWDILGEWEKRKKKYGDRDAWYTMLSSYYASGAYEDELPILAANAQGRPLLRPVGESVNRPRTYSSRRLTPIVDDYAALVGRMPTVRVEPPDDSEPAEQKADLLTKYLYSTYEMSNMEFQQAQAGHYLSLLGDSVYTLRPEPDLKRVMWEVVSPRNCYPTFYHGYRRFEVYDMLIVEQWTAEDLKRQLGIEPENNRPESCTVVIYLSPHQRTVVVGLKQPQVAAHVEWTLDYCPAVWVFNKITGHFGMSDIGPALGQQDFLDFSLNVWADGIVHMTYPIVGVKNPQSLGQDEIMIGPGSVVPLGPEGDIVVRATQGDPRALEAIIQQTIQDLNATTGTSQVRQEGQMKSSIVTGRAVQNVQGPQSTRIEFKQGTLGAAIEAANRITLQLQERAPILREFKGPIWGRYKGRSFQLQFSARQDIDGWYRNKASWQSLVGMNLQQKTAVAYEGMVAQIWDDIRAREIVGEEDPVGMRQRIENQKMSEARLQQAIAPALGGQQGGPPQQQQGPQLSIGGAQNPFSSQEAQQQGAAQPQAPATPDYKSEIKKIANTLKGSVWLLPTGVVAISDSRDYSKVLQAVRTASPQTKVRQMDESAIPQGATRLV